MKNLRQAVLLKFLHASGQIPLKIYACEDHFREMMRIGFSLPHFFVGLVGLTVVSGAFLAVNPVNPASQELGWEVVMAFSFFLSIIFWPLALPVLNDLRSTKLGLDLQFDALTDNVIVSAPDQEWMRQVKEAPTREVEFKKALTFDY